MSIERLDKILSTTGLASRSECKKMIARGRVSVDGAVITDSAFKTDDEKSIFKIDGNIVDIKKHIYIMLNKPKGVVSASNGKGDKTVVDLVPDNLFRKGLFPAGRLDKDTTGFVLITDDGDFAHRILSPKKHIEKTYIATIKSKLSDSDITLLSKGLQLRDGTTFLPAGIKVIESDEKVEVKICEGKYHQIKRMFTAVGNEVVELERIAMGKLSLDKDLLPGECREITNEELERIIG